MNGYRLLTTIVSAGKGKLIVKSAVDAGSFGGTVMSGRGISPSSIAAILGIDTKKDVVFIVTESEKKDTILNAIVDSTKNEKKHLGCIFVSDVDSLSRTGEIIKTEGENSMSENTPNDLITVILNSGYADDAMAAARKAGAGGGTVIKARGTAKEGDESFFGVQIVPEKEMLLIVVDHEKKDAVMSAIQKLECLSQPGSGIVFSSPVSQFNLLGKK